MTEADRRRLGIRLLRVGVLASSALAALMVLTSLPGHLFSRIALGEWSSFATRGQVGDYANFSYAVTGAVMLGWMISLWWMIDQVRDGVAGAWRFTAASILGWFALDSTTSVARGYPGNVLLNLSLTLVLVAGLWMTRSARTVSTTARGGNRGY